jgi:SagB-type dehydrogenase family enzyme
MRVKTGTTLQAKTSIEQVFEYHQRTKHKFDKYAQGPEFLDWDLQPNPYRFFKDVEKQALPLDLSTVDASYNRLYAESNENIQPSPLNIHSLGILLGLSLGLSAHKEYMGDRWSLRCNPSSGNLHPTEAYVICQQIDGLSNGVYHYLSEDHSLQQRMIPKDSGLDDKPKQLLLALSTISWRETWKYGERAFRYCQLDIGHALGAINYAAACLGWNVTLLNQWSTDNIASLCGLNREQDFAQAEIENGDVLLSISQSQQTHPDNSPDVLMNWATTGHWQGKANILDKHPIYHWPVIEQIESASKIISIEKHNTQQESTPPPLLNEAKYLKSESGETDLLAKDIIYGRRSAQRFDKQTVISQNHFYSLLDKCLYRDNSLPWNVLAEVKPMITVFYIHRVNRLTPGLYILANTHNNISEMKNLFHQEFLWHKPSNCPDHLPFYLLANTSTEKVSKSLSCHQAIASDGAFSLSILLSFEDSIKQQCMNYRKLHWQAGLLGHLLYLEAENIGMQGTGIGCFFDDDIHTVLGLSTNKYQVLYNFTIGSALNDARISTLPAYEHLSPNL